jgi:hypothetical protein
VARLQAGGRPQRKRLRLSPSEIQGLGAVLRSQLDLSISRNLGPVNAEDGGDSG